MAVETLFTQPSPLPNILLKDSQGCWLDPVREMTLRCLIFGHRRSRSRATFDDKHQHWISDCKRCHVLLVREAEGVWKPAPPQPEKLEPIERAEQAEEPPRPEQAVLSRTGTGAV